MKKQIVKQLYWIIPGLIVIFGLALLFYQNFSKVTEPPEPNWSRALTVGSTDVSRLPPIKEKENGNYLITAFKDEKLSTITINENFIVEDTKTYDIPVDKWTQIYQQDDRIIYFDYTNIYDSDKNEIVSDVERFFPLKNTILYIKDKKLYELSPEDNKSVKIMNIDLNKQNIVPQQNANEINIVTYTPRQTGIDFQLFQLHNSELEEKFQTEITVAPGKIVTDIIYALDGNKLGVILQEELENSQGKPVFFNYYKEMTLDGENEQQQKELTFQDPAGSSQLTEINSIEFKYKEGKPSLLFQANGQTETQYNDSTSFNIYKAEINSNGTTITERRSNTPAISVDPQWLNDETVAWVDLDNEGNKINISSSNITAVNQATGFQQDDWLRALGKTLGMISSSMFGIAISAVWFIWPLTFIALMYFFRSRTIDRDPTWVFYLGISIYAMAALFWKNQFFVPNIYMNAPNYLTFDGSSYFYMMLFAVIAYIIAQLTKQSNEWDGTVRIMYFVGVHILLLTAFFGPYLI
ncbi:hypothetical protein VBD025_11105 [Virgibacillus flavescens]|uniref:hypothetical protein n=1 Tax=Virgibacillus flavescens TaxID=1611422 RepID=UPI003D32A0D8